jgi:DNA recombination protein RmuC
VPYLLLVFQTILKSSQSIDMQRLDAYLRSAEESLELAQGELEGRFSRAITMLTNSRDELSVLLSRVRSGLTSLQITASRGTPGELPQGREDNEAQD